MTTSSDAVTAPAMTDPQQPCKLRALQMYREHEAALAPCGVGAHEVIQGRPGFGWFVSTTGKRPTIVAGPYTTREQAQSEVSRLSGGTLSGGTS
jgi:hypothetical protein